MTTEPPNEVPGPHPISSGGVATVDYMLDAYVNDSEAWLPAGPQLGPRRDSLPRRLDE